MIRSASFPPFKSDRGTAARWATVFAVFLVFVAGMILRPTQNLSIAGEFQLVSDAAKTLPISESYARAGFPQDRWANFLPGNLEKLEGQPSRTEANRLLVAAIRHRLSLPMNEADLMVLSQSSNRFARDVARLYADGPWTPDDARQFAAKYQDLSGLYNVYVAHSYDRAGISDQKVALPDRSNSRPDYGSLLIIFAAGYLMFFRDPVRGFKERESEAGRLGTLRNFTVFLAGALAAFLVLRLMPSLPVSALGQRAIEFLAAAGVLIGVLAVLQPQALRKCEVPRPEARQIAFTYGAAALLVCALISLLAFFLPMVGRSPQVFSVDLWLDPNPWWSVAYRIGDLAMISAMALGAAAFIYPALAKLLGSERFGDRWDLVALGLTATLGSLVWLQPSVNTFIWFPLVWGTTLIFRGTRSFWWTSLPVVILVLVQGMS